MPPQDSRRAADFFGKTQRSRNWTRLDLHGSIAASGLSTETVNKPPFSIDLDCGNRACVASTHDSPVTQRVVNHKRLIPNALRFPQG